MAQIKWTEPALEDINEIAEYIALDKPSAAKRLVQNIFESVKRLKEFPDSGRVPIEISDSRYRELIVGPCRIFYRVDKDVVYVLYVMRIERMLRKLIIYDRANEN
jgi:toxin ParE1/3/4